MQRDVNIFGSNGDFAYTIFRAMLPWALRSFFGGDLSERPRNLTADWKAGRKSFPPFVVGEGRGGAMNGFRTKKHTEGEIETRLDLVSSTFHIYESS